MKILEPINAMLASCFISDFENTDNKDVRIRYGLLAGWISIVAILILFVVKMVLGLMAESPKRIVIVADVDVKEDVPESEFEQIAKDLESTAREEIPNISYCQFYITPKFAY